MFVLKGVERIVKEEFTSHLHILLTLFPPKPLPIEFDVNSLDDIIRGTKYLPVVMNELTPLNLIVDLSPVLSSSQP